MSDVHVPAGDLELYVLGALDERRASELELHVVACAVCARTLAREARLEIASPMIVASARRHKRSTAAAVRAAGFAVAAAAVAVFALGAASAGGARISRGEIDAHAASASQTIEWGCADGGEGQRCGTPWGDVPGVAP